MELPKFPSADCRSDSTHETEATIYPHPHPSFPLFFVQNKMGALFDRIPQKSARSSGQYRVQYPIAATISNTSIEGCIQYSAS